MTQHEVDSSRIRVCVQCKNEWEFTEKEERFLREKFGVGFKEPRRCIPCRKANREAEDSRGNR
jgi:hypothetical protein